MRYLFVAVGGAMGAMTRFGVNQAVGPRSLPWATLLINVTGSFALGAFVFVAADRGWSPELTLGIGVGFLGAYTTFSTFTWETFDLGRTDRVLTAALYVGVSVTLGVLAAAAGHHLARSVSQ